MLLGAAGGLAHRLGGDAAQRRDAGGHGGPVGQYRRRPAARAAAAG